MGRAPGGETHAFSGGRPRTRDLELLVTIETLRNLHRVAEHLGTTQSAISRSLQQLEVTLDATLFLRTPQGMVPTGSGQLWIDHARRCLELMDGATRQVAAERSGRGQRLDIGVNYSSSAMLLPRSLAFFGRDAPDTVVSVHEGALSDLLPQLHAHRLDAVIARLGPLADPELYVCEVLTSGRMRLVCSRSHPLASQADAGWDLLCAQRWIMPPANSPMRRSLDDVLRARAPGGVRHRVESASALLNMALLDDHESVAVMPEVVALRLQRLGALVVLPQLLPDVFDPIAAIRLVHGRHAPALQRFLACVREVAADGDLSLSSP